MSMLKKVDEYYTDKILTHGISPKGVDWSTKESQILRFQQLSKIFNQKSFSIGDIGCGYGEFINYLNAHFSNFEYHGYDISIEMINEAKKLFSNNLFHHIKDNSEIKPHDFLILSGLFNLKFEYQISEWKDFVKQSLIDINKKAIKGFSFNILTSYSDKEKMRDDLYYADPMEYFDFCKRNFSRNISLLHDYDLYEFTILVRK